MSKLKPTVTICAMLLAGGLRPALAETVKVGVVQSITGGSAAVYGTVQRNAAALAIDQINKSGELGSLKLEAIYADDGGDRGQTVDAFQRLLNQDKVSAIFGATLSNSTFAAAPLAQRAHTIVIASSNTATGIPEIGDYIFRTSPSEAVTFPGVLKFAKEKYHLKTAAQIYGIDDVSMKANAEVHRVNLKKEGIRILASETFQKGDVDYSAQLTKIKAAKPDAIVISALAEEVANIVRQARQLGIPKSTIFIASNSAINPKFSEIAGPAGEGLLAGAGWFVGFPGPSNKAFVEAYRQKYGVDPDTYAAYEYTAFLAFADALKRAGGAGDEQKIRDALAATRNLDLPLGSFSFTKDREPVIEPKILVVKNGKFVLATGAE